MDDGTVEAVEHMNDGIIINVHSSASDSISSIMRPWRPLIWLGWIVEQRIISVRPRGEFELNHWVARFQVKTFILN